jgi:hypothetical protein
MKERLVRAIYRLEIAPSEDEGAGEDHDEWFSSLEEAKRRRSELIKIDPRLEGHRYNEDFSIWRYVPARLSPRRLLIAALNRKDWVEDHTLVVPSYKPRNAGNE